MSTCPSNMEELIQQRLRWMKVNHYAKGTQTNHSYMLKRFLDWCEQREIQHYQQISPPVLQSFQRWVYSQTTPKGKPWSLRYQRSLLGSVWGLFQWTYQQNFLLCDPTPPLKYPTHPDTLPKAILSKKEIETIVTLPDIQTPIGLRDRAILELLYATAIRASEVVKLTPDHIDRERLIIWIRQAKGKRDRIVPLTQRALRWIERYEQQVRNSRINQGQVAEHLFLTHKGNPFSIGALQRIVTAYIKEITPSKEGSCHLIRHSVATLLLENGCDIRYIQEFLGHKQLQSTQVYTRVSINALKTAYLKAHPGQRKRRGHA